MTQPYGVEGHPQPRWPTALVAATVLVFAGGLPVLAARVTGPADIENEPDRSAIDSAPAAGAVPADSVPTYLPAAGWRPVEPEDDRWSSTLVSKGARFSVRAVPVPASSDCQDVLTDAGEALQEAAELSAMAAGASVATADGVAGEMERFAAAEIEGLVFAACHEGIAVVAEVVSPIGLGPDSDEAVEMLESVRFP